MIEIITEKMINYFAPDVRRINHAIKVYGFANCIARKEKLSDTDIFIVEATAILHDIGIKEAEIKHNSTIGHYQEMEGPAVAKQLMAEMNIDSKIVERICFIIGNHHSYQKIDGTDFQIIIEADFLVNVHEDNISAQAIESMQKKYFKTNTGLSLLEAMYQ